MTAERNPRREVTLHRRTASERDAYLQGFEAGARTALHEVRRLNFSDVADRAAEKVHQQLALAGVVVLDESQSQHDLGLER